MARTVSPLTVAALAEVESEPSRFWPIFQRLESSIGSFWQVNDGGVHAALRSAKAKGWVSVAPGEDGRDVYAITPSGAKMLARWREQAEFDVPPLRDDMYVRLLYGSPVPDLTFGVEGKIAETRAKLREIRRLRDKADSTLASLAYDGVVRHLETQLDWLVDVHAHLMEIDTTATSAVGGGGHP
ncbi:MAG: PadR family transcriptional regulator [Acidimicrobiia bacterium]|nr:PadR family transcriptional regulator [Acidimicrobiia bacterium]